MSKYRIWHKGKLVPAYKQKPKNTKAKPLTVRSAEERKIGLNWYLPEE